MISGSKEVTLFDPSDNTRFYEGHIREAILEYDASRDVFHRETLMTSTSMVNSPIDLQHPNTLRYPRFQDAHALSCRIHAGETLYLPAFWWHEVQSIPHEGRNVAVNFWTPPFYNKAFPCAECTLHVNLKEYQHLLKREILNES